MGKSSKSRDDRYDWLRPLCCLFLVALVVAHAVAPSKVSLDKTTVVVLVLLAIVVMAPLLESAELLGIGRWRFRRKVAEAEEVTEAVEKQSIENAEEMLLRRGSSPEVEPTTIEEVLALFRIPDSLRDLIPVDPNLALAGLRLEVQRGLGKALLLLSTPFQASVSDQTLISPWRALEQLREATGRQLLSETQERLLRLVLDLCNKAVHGRAVEPIDASRVFDMADTLNRSFILGCSLNVEPNPHYEDQGLVCEYEHCIENMPISEESTERSCPFWGHDCPGGTDRVSSCDVASQVVDAKA